MLTRSTPEGARDFLVPSRVPPGSLYALPQSPQIFKQLLMIGGFERYYQIARCFRDEYSRADRLPEFTQLDVELSFVDEDDVIATVDPLMREVLALGGVEVPDPIERMPYDEAMLRYGTRPPRPARSRSRSPTSARCSPRRSSRCSPARWPPAAWSRGFSGAGRVPAQALRRAHRAGAALRREGPRLGSGRARRLALAGGQVPLRGGDRRPDQATTGAQEGDAILVVADDARHRRARARRPAPRGRRARATGDDFLWVVDFPMFGWNEAEGAGTRCTIRSPRRAATSTPIRARGAAAATTSSGTAPRSAAARSASTPPRFSRRCSTAIGLSEDQARERFGFLLDALTLRRAAARRHRVRDRPDRGAARRPRLDPRRDRVPQDWPAGSTRSPAPRRRSTTPSSASWGCSCGPAAGPAGNLGQRVAERQWHC